MGSSDTGQGLTSIWTTLQNGVTAANNLSQILSQATANSSSLRVTLSSTFFPASSATIVSVTKQVFTTPGAFTYTPTANMAFCIAEGVGGGGGGGGSSTTSATIILGGAGGAGGGYARVTLTAATVGTASTGAVGAGGAGATAGANAGSSGTATTLGSFLSAGGGSGGTGVSGGILPAAVAGGVSTSGDVLIQGGFGNYGCLAAENAENVFLPSGNGGHSYFGSGGQGASALVGGSGRGSPGYNYGGGGAGAIQNAVAGNSSGSSGAGGILIVTEYIHG